MKISWFKRDITPAVGTRISGYGMEDVSFSQWSALLMTGLLADDGERKVLLISFDLQCLDVEYIRKFRRLCGEILEMPPESVMPTFTHTHGGPQSRLTRKSETPPSAPGSSTGKRFSRHSVSRKNCGRSSWGNSIPKTFSAPPPRASERGRANVGQVRPVRETGPLPLNGRKCV